MATYSQLLGMQKEKEHTKDDQKGGIQQTTTDEATQQHDDL